MLPEGLVSPQHSIAHHVCVSTHTGNGVYTQPLLCLCWNLSLPFPMSTSHRLWRCAHQGWCGDVCHSLLYWFYWACTVALWCNSSITSASIIAFATCPANLCLGTLHCSTFIHWQKHFSWPISFSLSTTYLPLDWTCNLVSYIFGTCVWGIGEDHCWMVPHACWLSDSSVGKRNSLPFPGGR